MIYVGLSSALACRVFHMVLLCETDDDGGMGVVTLGMDAGVAGAMTLASAQFARRLGDEEDGYEDDDGDAPGSQCARGGVSVSVSVLVCTRIANDFRFPCWRVRLGGPPCPFPPTSTFQSLNIAYQPPVTPSPSALPRSVALLQLCLHASKICLACRIPAPSLFLQMHIQIAWHEIL
ncbi:hypothetical protein FIBSPDRAFT_532294 [Athelia psychrophila]|uniref:Uncharacterized protein n=1 Tax=Athelia psychrophila TaxID=1759441 RepID=A0A166J8X5_9AGAM|nr:hypothetical protein FIBSPDRAFT_532294 [Fibularhizoctonia sp. CBS 109695]